MAEPAPPRSLLVTVNYPPSIGGIERYYAELALHMPAGSIEVSTPPLAGSREHDASHPVRVWRPPIPRRQSHKLVFVFVWWLHVLGVCVRRRIRLLHCGNFTPAGYICRWTKRWLGIPYVIYFHGMDIEKAARKMERPGWRSRALRAILDDASMVFANSRDTMRRVIRSGVPEEKIVSLSPGVDLDRFQPGAPASPRAAQFAGRPVLLTVGRYAKRKGIDLVVRALPLVRREIPEAQLVILGRRQEENLAPLVRELGLDGAVHFFGEVEESELPDFYRAASGFVMPAYEEEDAASVEGFGIVFLEAAASGIPSIGGRSGGIEDAIVDGETGFLVEGRNVDDLAARMREILGCETRRRQMGEKARARVLAEFNWETRALRVANEVRRAARS
jgi:phosphatidylinositol alpha-1,6-mannosyltransferase